MQGSVFPIQPSVHMEYKSRLENNDLSKNEWAREGSPPTTMFQISKHDFLLPLGQG